MVTEPVKGTPINIDWARGLVRDVNSAAPSFAGGLSGARSPAGTAYHLALEEVPSSPKPQLFDLKIVTNDSEGLDLYMYVGSDLTYLVRRNGYPTTPPALEPNAGYWAVVKEAIDLETTYYVTILIQTVAASGGPSATWEIKAEVLEPTAALGFLTAPNSPITIGCIVTGKIVQFHRGQLSTYHTLFDDESGTFHSLQYFGSDRKGQLFGFEDLDNLISIDLGNEEEGTTPPDNIDMVLRVEGSTGTTIEYCSLASLAEYVENVIEENGTLDPDPDPYGLGALPDGGFYGYDSTADQFVNLDDRYWHQGGSSVNCYGSDIGNSGSNKVIDLDAVTLMGDDWIVKDSDDVFAITIENRMLSSKNSSSVAKKSVDWQLRKMFAASEDEVIDWENGIIFSPEGGFTFNSIKWIDRQLYRSDSSAWSVDWQECKLADKLGFTRLDWDGLQLTGDWSVATGGSFDTPTLKVGGTTYTTATELINGTSYTFLVQV